MKACIETDPCAYQEATLMSVTTVRLGGRPDRPLLLLGAAAGTSVQTLWQEVAADLARDFQVVGWDLPGHGSNTRHAGVHNGGLSTITLRSLTRDLIDAIDRLLDTAPGAPKVPIHYAGHGVSGAVGVLLATERPEQVASLAIVGSCLEASRRALPSDPVGLGVPERLATTRPNAAESLRAASARIGGGAVGAVRRAHDQVDLREELRQLSVPLLAIHGAQDPRCDAATISALVASTPSAHSRVEVLADVSHLPAVEEPEVIARLLRAHIQGDGADAHEAADNAGGELDAVSEALVRLAVLAAQRGSTGHNGARLVLESSRAAARAGASAVAVEQTLRLAWGERDTDGRLSAKISGLLKAAAS